MNSQNVRITTDFSGLDIPNLHLMSRVEYRGSDNAPLQPHLHKDCFELCYHFEGRQHYELGGRLYDVHSGDIFIAMPNELHSTGLWTEEKSKFYYLIFSCMPDTRNFLGLDDAASDCIRDTLYSIQTRLFRGIPILKKLMDELLSISTTPSPFCRARTVSLLTELFYHLSRLLQTENTGTDTIPEDIRTIIDYMGAHLAESCRSESLAGLIHLSPPQFQRKFRRSTGFSPYDYLQRLRIDKAQELLAGSEMSVTDISHSLGFSSSQHFAGVFKQYTGQTPSAFRRKLR
ncbi:hypothetical protein GCM10008922_47060 [Faecalicatena contorta]|uniref:AraC family transcriptional regulator n=1 Tax=Faecalicatena contorta TaxID=39482 RepID=UPI0031DB5F21